MHREKSTYMLVSEVKLLMMLKFVWLNTFLWQEKAAFIVVDFPIKKKAKILKSSISSSRQLAHNSGLYYRGSDIWGWGLLCCESQRAAGHVLELVGGLAWSLLGHTEQCTVSDCSPSRCAAFPWKWQELFLEHSPCHAVSCDVRDLSVYSGHLHGSCLFFSGTSFMSWQEFLTENRVYTGVCLYPSAFLSLVLNSPKSIRNTTPVHCFFLSLLI